MAPGYIKIVGALKLLLKEKEFNAITWAEIARTAGVNEALIYKYFHDKRNLLYKVLRQFLEKYIAEVEGDLKVTSGALEQAPKGYPGPLQRLQSGSDFCKDTGPGSQELSGLF